MNVEEEAADRALNRVDRIRRAHRDAQSQDLRRQEFDLYVEKGLADARTADAAAATALTEELVPTFLETMEAIDNPGLLRVNTWESPVTLRGTLRDLFRGEPAPPRMAWAIAVRFRNLGEGLLSDYTLALDPNGRLWRAAQLKSQSGKAAHLAVAEVAKPDQLGATAWGAASRAGKYPTDSPYSPYDEFVRVDHAFEQTIGEFMNRYPEFRWPSLS